MPNNFRLPDRQPIRAMPNRRVPPGTLFAALVRVSLALVLGWSSISAAACASADPYVKFSYSFTSSFDTVIQLVAYTRTQAEFDPFAAACEAQFRELHHLYDIYHPYDGLNNLWTVNQHAGMGPVAVDSRILDLIEFCQVNDRLAAGKVNLALGPVITLWQRYREAAESGSGRPAIPTSPELAGALAHTDPDTIIVDRTAGTLELTDPATRLDVGAVAKGYATELVAQSLSAMGLTSGIVSAGGSNVRLIGQPLARDRKTWQIGITNPFGNVLVPDEQPIDVIEANQTSIVTSGDYQRAYLVNGVLYHHLIDPVTGMPARYFRAVTIMTPDSGLADFLSTAVFLLPYAEGRALVESLPDCEALWVFADGTLQATAGMTAVLQDEGRNPARSPAAAA